MSEKLKKIALDAALKLPHHDTDGMLKAAAKIYSWLTKAPESA